MQYFGFMRLWVCFGGFLHDNTLSLTVSTTRYLQPCCVSKQRRACGGRGFGWVTGALAGLRWAGQRWDEARRDWTKRRSGRGNPLLLFSHLFCSAEVQEVTELPGAFVRRQKPKEKTQVHGAVCKEKDPNAAIKVLLLVSIKEKHESLTYWRIPTHTPTNTQPWATDGKVKGLGLPEVCAWASCRHHLWSQILSSSSSSPSPSLLTWHSFITCRQGVCFAAISMRLVCHSNLGWRCDSLRGVLPRFGSWCFLVFWATFVSAFKSHFWMQE